MSDYDISLGGRFSFYESSYRPLKNTEIKRDLREETVLLFYTSMLECIIQEKVTLNITEDSYEDEPPANNLSLYESEFELLADSIIAEQRKSYKDPVSSVVSTNFKIKKKKGMKKNKALTYNFSNIIIPKEKPWFVERVEETVRIKFNNGNYYEGIMYCNMLHGRGKYFWSNGTSYEGEFKHNEITGKGYFQFPDQSTYTGEVFKNFLHGTGLLYLSNSPCFYKGNFYYNVKHGFGWQLFSDNNTYEGEWVEDHITGEGCRRYPNGAVYYGQFLMGKRHGFGVAVLPNNDVYSGDWVEGDMEGFGDYTWNMQKENVFAVPVQNCYYGSWVENKRDGIGVINFGMEGGSRYAGYFSNNEKHGSGVIVCENGHVIESNPLFVNDKPVHITTTGEIETSQQTSEDPSCVSNDFVLSDMDICNRQERLLKRFPPDHKLPCATPNSEERSAISLYKHVNAEPFKENTYHPDRYDIVFPKIQDHYSSINIPIARSSELIDLNAFIYKIIEYKSYAEQNKERSTTVSSDMCSGRSSSVETYADYELHTFEEKMIREVINKYLSHLRRIYHLYARIGCIEKQTPYKVWLIRVFFWQLYRDCKIPQKGISLLEIDLMFSEKSTFDCIVVHNPFEIIYFWQFLESLLYVALMLYGDKFISSEKGVLGQSFDCLMKEDILPNAGKFKGSALFEYRDVIPIKAAYDWYKSFGEPHTAKDFFSNIFILKKTRKETICYAEEYLHLPYIQMGYNCINCGNKIFYFQEEECYIPTKPTAPKIKTIHRKETTKLHFLDRIKPKRVIKILISECPGMIIDEGVINFEYKISFLEFYEILLQCTREKIRCPLRRHEPKRSIVPAPRITHEIKKKRIRISSLTRKLKKAQG